MDRPAGWCRQETSPALAAALSQVLGDPETAKAFGEAGRDRAREFTVSAIVERIEQMYRDAIEAPMNRQAAVVVFAGVPRWSGLRAPMTGPDHDGGGILDDLLNRSVSRQSPRPR